MDHLGLLPILGDLFGIVIVPPAVAAELAGPRARFRPIDVRGIEWVNVTAPRDLGEVAALEREVDTAEAEAIILASELRADLILIDERVGRRIAQERGLVTTGVLGVLIRAKAAGHVALVGPLAIRLRDELGFRLSEQVIAEAKRLAGEV